MPEPAVAEPPSAKASRVGHVREPKLRPRADSPGSSDEFDPPRPFRAAVLQLAPVAVPAALWAFGALPVPAAAVFVAVFALVAGLRVGLGVHDLLRSRRLGDALLRGHPGVPPISALAAWRSAELISDRHRRRLAGFVRQLRRETEACAARSVPVDDAVVEESVRLLRSLELRLELLIETVAPLGMLEVAALARDSWSPLYFPERAHDLPAALRRALEALEPR